MNGTLREGTASLGPLQVRLEEVEVREGFEGPNLGRGKREMGFSPALGCEVAAPLCALRNVTLCPHKGLMHCDL